MIPVSAQIELLKALIATPSISRSEENTASLIFDHLKGEGIDVRRFKNNIWAVSRHFVPGRTTILLNSHHDTVRPADNYTRDPYTPTIENGRLYGLGSNDAGASVVSLIAAFLAFEKLPEVNVNIILAITAEEEVGGENGMRAFLPHLKENGYSLSCAIVGEPTGLNAAIAERGLVVLDAITPGQAGHAARGEGINAIYRALEDIERIRAFQFAKTSEVLGPIGIAITQISAGTQHNVIPAECRWVIDIRTTDAYSNSETAEILQNAVKWSTLTPRSTRVQPSVISEQHTLVIAAKVLGATTFVSPTTSDMSLMYGLPSLKIGPGRSERSHRADEFIELDEITAGANFYFNLLNTIK